jgi:hypothetical protein
MAAIHSHRSLAPNQRQKSLINSDLTEFRAAKPTFKKISRQKPFRATFAQRTDVTAERPSVPGTNPASHGLLDHKGQTRMRFGIALPDGKPLPHQSPRSDVDT